MWQPRTIFKTKTVPKYYLEKRKLSKLSVFTDFFRINTNRFQTKDEKMLLLLNFIFLGVCSFTFAFFTKEFI